MKNMDLICEADNDALTSRGKTSPEGIEAVVERPERIDGDRRRPRIEVTLVVTLESESNLYVGFTENLSEGGVFVATHALRKIGSAVDLVIELAQQPPIRAKGSVRWLRQYSEVNETDPGMGIRFDQLSAEDAGRLHEFAKARQPIFFDDEVLAEK
jgi:uncharacterized protein (TIGR02266 family)